MKRRERTRPSVPVPLDERARLELEQVHRCELGRLLRDAAELVLAASGREPRLFGADEPPSLLGWRIDAGEALALAALDRLEDLVPDELAACARRDPGAWPEPERLATAALLLEDCEEGRLVLGRAQLAAGRPHAALATLAAARRRGVSRARRWRWLGALARANGESGADGLALESLGLALREPECGPGLAYAALVLGLQREDLDVAGRAVARIDARRPSARSARVLCREARELLRERGEPLPFVPRGRGVPRAFAAWARRDTPAGELCRSLATGGGLR